MKSFKVAIASVFIAATVVVLAGPTFGYPPFLAKARKFGAKDCTFCHVDPEGGPPWNDRGKWLIKEKERRAAETVDVEWLADYNPGADEVRKPADAQKPADAATKSDEKKTAPPAAQTGKVDSKTFDDYVGEYELAIGTLVVTHEGDKLFAQPRDVGNKEELQPEEDGGFSVTNVNAKVTFSRDDKGKITEILVKLNGEEMKGKKIK